MRAEQPAPVTVSRPAGRRVWDLPIRVFHWTLVALVVTSFITAKVGGLWMDWHMRSGYAILALVVFRIFWGFAGSQTARFAGFIRPPGVVLEYLRGRIPPSAGHSPAGGWSVLVLLVLLSVQGSTGLFANDGSFTEGTLARFVSGANGDRLSSIHRYGEWAMLAMVGLHVAAIAYYAALRRQPLVRAMITGEHPAAHVDVEDSLLTRLRALVLAGLASGLVAFVVTL